MLRDWLEFCRILQRSTLSMLQSGAAGALSKFFFAIVTPGCCSPLWNLGTENMEPVFPMLSVLHQLSSRQLPDLNAVGTRPRPGCVCGERAWDKEVVKDQGERHRDQELW